MSGQRDFRQIAVADIPSLAHLMDRAYQGTIDHEGESPEQCVEEIRATLTGKYGRFLDFASFAIFEGQQAISASIVTLWKNQPLLAFSMTVPSAQGLGHAAFVIERSISALAQHGHPEFFLAVTQGNAAAERLYERLGFKVLGPGVAGQPTPTE